MKLYLKSGSVILPLLILFAGVPYFGSIPRLGPFPGLATWFLIWIILLPVVIMIVDHFVREEDDH